MLSYEPPILCIKDYEKMGLLGLRESEDSNKISFSVKACDPVNPPEG